jgi:acetoin utilization protein AcuB
MIHDAKVRDYMSTPLIAVETTTSIRVAQQLMEDQHIRHLPVVRDNKLVGILSSGDIRRAGPSSTSTLSLWEAAQRWEDITVEEVMSREIVRVRPDTLVTRAAELMIAYHFNSVPVVDHRDFPIGIVTEVDVFRLLLNAAKREQEPVRVPTTPLPAEIG